MKTLWWMILGYAFQEYYAVRHLKELGFNYQSFALYPDVIHVYRGNVFLFTYKWLDGLELSRRTSPSALGLVHLEYERQHGSEV